MDSLLDTLRGCVCADSDMISLASPTKLKAERVETPETLPETPADAELAERLRVALANS